MNKKIYYLNGQLLHHAVNALKMCCANVTTVMKINSIVILGTSEYVNNSRYLII